MSYPILFGTMAAVSSGSQTSLGDMDPLITQYVSSTQSGTVSSISFNNIPQTYQHLQIRGVGYFSTANNPLMRFNGDTGSNYSWHHAWTNGSSGNNYNYGTSQTFMYVGYADSANQPVTFWIDIFDYRNINKHKSIKAIHAGETNGGSGETALWSGTWRNKASAVTSIQLLPGGGTFTAGTMLSLYGVK